MKRIFCLCLFCILSGGVLQAQAKYNVKPATEDKDWYQLLYHGWEPVNVSGESGPNNLTDLINSHDIISIDFRPSKRLVLCFSNAIMSCPFSMFENEGERYLLVGSVALIIKKLDKDSLVLKARPTMLSPQNFILTLVRKGVREDSANRMLAHSWMVINRTERAGERKGKIVLELKNNGDCILLRDSAIQHGNWVWNKHTLELTTSIKGQRDRYEVEAILPGRLILSYKGKADSICMMELSSQTPEQALTARSSLTIDSAVTVADTTSDSPNSLKAVGEMLIGAWKVTEKKDVVSQSSLKLDQSAFLTIRSDSTFVLLNGKKKVKGKWRYAADSWILLLEINKQERYCPLSDSDLYNSGGKQMNRFALDLALPGEQKVAELHFGRVEDAPRK